jgi:amino acid adenylation domain-containing protein
MGLHHLIESAVRDHAPAVALIEGGNATRVDYATLGRVSDRLRNRLVAMGIGRGDRVGIYLRKSADSVAAIFGILKTGAAYVPVDPGAPASRNAYIHHNCGIKAVVVEKSVVDAYRQELGKLIETMPPMIVLDSVGACRYLDEALAGLEAQSVAPVAATVNSTPEDLAYILYTSGSTGKPKGVMLSHGNALSFIDWCSRVFQPQPDDVFSSHAPFHFDLSILDIYVPLKHGASLVLIGENFSKEPQVLSKLIADHRVTVWYSAPSILSLLAQFGKIASHDYSHLRMVLFAGEVFPIVHLRSFKRQVPQPRYYNLYGPTETNVCTYYEIPVIVPDDRLDPYPIGKTCENLSSKVVDADGKVVARGTEGELCIAGPNVMQGYWGMPEQTAKGFLDDDGSGWRWYKTGDIVVEEADDNYRYVGRRDRMIKRRGYRVELGEIEACLYRHPEIREAAVVALVDEVAGVRVKAHLSLRNEKRPSLVELKAFCSRYLPLYMIPDTFAFHAVLPKTSTDKVDYQSLKTLN